MELSGSEVMAEVACNGHHAEMEDSPEEGGGEAAFEGDDLMLMGTPPRVAAKDTDPSKTPAGNDVDQLLAFTPQEPNRPIVPATPAVEAGQSLDQIVQVLKYSEAELAATKRDLHLDYESRILAKEREWAKQKDGLLKEAKEKDGEVQKLKVSHDEMKSVVTEFERTVVEVMAERDNREGASDSMRDRMDDLMKERDSALEDVRSVESAFSDLHKRYEKSKQALEDFKNNEGALKTVVDELKGQVGKEKTRYLELKAHAEKKLDRANEDIAEVRRETSLELTRLQAALRKAEMEARGLSAALEQKTLDNAELSAICDELLGKVGPSSGSS